MKTQEKNNQYLFMISIVAALGGLLFGFDTAVILGVVLFIEKQFALMKLNYLEP